MPVQIKLFSYFKSFYQLCLIAFRIIKGNLHFSHLLEDVFLGKDIIISQKGFSKNENSAKNFFANLKRCCCFFKKLKNLKDRLYESWIIPNIYVGSSEWGTSIIY